MKGRRSDDDDDDDFEELPWPLVVAIVLVFIGAFVIAILTGWGMK